MTQYVPSNIGICVRDLERSVRFYCDGLGFSRGELHELDGAEMPGLGGLFEILADVALRLQVIERDGWRIELLEFRSPAPVGSPSARRNQLGLTHLAVYVDNVDVAAERLLEYGALVLDGTRARNLGTDVMFVMDPDGVRVALLRGTPPARDA
jgi:catechol 2,3-dioxygenase-like lactoylglutathione lyase family enzyme